MVKVTIEMPNGEKQETQGEALFGLCPMDGGSGVIIACGGDVETYKSVAGLAKLVEETIKTLSDGSETKELFMKLLFMKHMEGFIVREPEEKNKSEEKPDSKSHMMDFLMKMMEDK